jgi:hypothetical protein
MYIQNVLNRQHVMEKSILYKSLNSKIYKIMKY